MRLFLRVPSGAGQPHPGLKSAVGRIGELQRAAMTNYRPSGYCQAQPMPAIGRLARDPYERLSQSPEPVCRDARALIFDNYLALAGLTAKRY